MARVYESVTCKGCGTRIAIKELRSKDDEDAYRWNARFNADVPCDNCKETFAYGPEDIEVIEEK